MLGILLTLFPLVLRTVCIVVCRSQSHCLSDVVCVNVAAAPEHMLIRMYLKSVDSCIHLFASSVVEAAATRSASLITVVEFSVFSNNCGSALSISPMYAWNLYFHSSKVPVVAFCTCAC